MNRGIFGLNQGADPRTPLLQMFLNAIQSGVVNATVTPVQFDTVQLDTHSWWDKGNFIYRPKLAGYYRITAQVQCQTATTINYLQLFPRKNGATLATVLTAAGASGTTIAQANGSFWAAANGSSDYFDIAALISGTGAEQFNVGATLQIDYMRPL